MVELVTCGGRIIWGNPLKSKVKTDNNNQPVKDENGVPVQQWSFGFAVAKTEAGIQTIFGAMQAEAATIFPQGAPQNFAWKVKDGDGLDDKNQPFANREGYAGHFVFAISTEAFAPRVVRLVNGSYQDMKEGLKTGDYVRLGLNIKAHAGKANVRGSVPGLYFNPIMIEFLGYGTEIISGPDAMTLFGGTQAALPAGASPTPIAPAGALPFANAAAVQPVPGAGFQPQNTQQTVSPINPAPAAVQVAPAAVQVQPHPTFVAAATGQPPATTAAPGSFPFPT